MLKILAIDDINDNLISLKAIIDDAFPGSFVFTALNGPKGIELALANDPDVILLDIIMPEMDGFEVCRLLKLDERTLDIPVVFLTALKGDKENRIKALEVGAEGFLSKPIDETELIAQVRAMVKIKAASKQRRNEKEQLEKLVEERTVSLQNELEERKKAEKSLRKTKNHFSALIDKAPDGVVLVSAEGRFLFASPAALKLFGYSADEYLSANPNDLTFPEDLPYVLSELEKLLCDPSYSPTIQYRFASKDGSWRWIESTFTNMLSNPDIQAIIINFRDITERKRANEALKSSLSLTEATLESIHNGILVDDHEGKMIKTNSRFAEMWRIPEHMIASDDDKIMKKSILDQLVNPDEFTSKVMELYATPEAKSTDLIYFKDGRIFERVSKPMIIEDMPKGRIWSFLDITGHRRAENELRENVARLELAMSTAKMAWWEMDIKTGQVTFERRKAEMLGYAPERFKHYTDFTALVHPEDHERTMNAMRLHLDGSLDKYEVEYRIKTISGEYKWFYDIGSVTKRDSEGKPLIVSGLVLNISERKFAEEARKESYEFNQSLLRTIPFGMNIVDEYGNILFQNENFENTFGKNAIGGKCWEFYCDDKSRCRECPLQRGIEVGKTATYESAGMFGERIFEIIHTGMIYKGKKAMLEIFQDITERKKAEEALLESQALYYSFVEHLPVGVFRKNSEGRYIFVNSKFCELKGLTADEIVGKMPDELVKYELEIEATRRPERMGIQRTLANVGFEHHDQIMRTGKPIELEEVYPQPNGKIHYFQVVKSPVFSSTGKVVGSQGIQIDITDRKQALEELQKSHDLLEKLADQVPGVVYQYRLYPDGRSAFPFSSPGMFDIYEVTPDEVREDASPVFTRIHPDDYDYIVETITESARNQTIYHSEFRVILPKQGLRWRMSDAKPELLEDGSTLWHGIITDITERKQNEEALLEREQLFKSLFNASPDAILLMETNHPTISWPIIDCNEAACRMNGYTREEMIGRSIDILHQTSVYKEERDAYYSDLKKEGILSRENIHRHKDGHLFPIESSTTIVTIGGHEMVLGIDRDITDRKQAEFELIEKNTFIQTILDNLPIGIALNSIDNGIALYMNKKFEEIYGWPSQEIKDIAEFFKNVYPDENYRNELIKTIMTDIQSGDPQRMHWENIFVTRKDGSKRVINAVNIPLVEQNTMVSTVSDITELHKSQNDLVAAKEKAEESDQLKSAFLANMSHEIRTPLNSIIGFSDLLFDPEFDEEQKKSFAENISLSGNGLLAIISDIMDLSKIETGQVQVNKSKFSINRIVSDIHREYSLQASRKGIELRIDPLNPEAIFIESDQDKLRQVLINLVTNALKFTEKGFVEMGIRDQGDCVYLQVKDTGIGIPDEYHNKVFERFRQVESAKSRKYGGNGLGLAISKSLVEMLGGKIGIESVEGSGSTFYFTIPK